MCYSLKVFEYTYKNHFKFGYDGINNFQKRSTKEQNFSFEYGKTVDFNLNWRQANELAARQIYEKKSGDLYILLSGGMDSEICFKSFFDQKIPVQTISLRFKDIDQSEELSFIEKAISNYKIKNHIFVEVEVKKFVFSQEFEDLADRLKCVSPIIVLHLWLANQIKGTPVIAQGEIHLKKNIPSGYVPGVSPYLPSEWYLVESERLCSIYSNFIDRNASAVPGFFQYNVEQIYSYLTKNSYLTDLINNQIHGKLGTRTSKNIISQQFYPEIEMREKKHGWESAQDFHDKLRKMLGDKYLYNNQSACLTVDQVLKMIVT